MFFVSLQCGTLPIANAMMFRQTPGTVDGAIAHPQLMRLRAMIAENHCWKACGVHFSQRCAVEFWRLKGRSSHRRWIYRGASPKTVPGGAELSLRNSGVISATALGESSHDLVDPGLDQCETMFCWSNLPIIWLQTEIFPLVWTSNHSSNVVSLHTLEQSTSVSS